MAIQAPGKEAKGVVEHPDWGDSGGAILPRRPKRRKKEDSTSMRLKV